MKARLLRLQRNAPTEQVVAAFKGLTERVVSIGSQNKFGTSEPADTAADIREAIAPADRETRTGTPTASAAGTLRLAPGCAITSRETDDLFGAAAGSELCFDAQAIPQVLHAITGLIGQQANGEPKPFERRDAKLVRALQTQRMERFDEREVWTIGTGFAGHGGSFSPGHPVLIAPSWRTVCEVVGLEAYL